MTRTRLSLAALALASCSSHQALVQEEPTSPRPAEPVSALEVVVIGASLAAGPDSMLGARSVDNSEAFDDLHVYGDILEHLEPTWSLENLGDTWFFTQPETLGDDQVESAIDLDPGLVLALDFPFWFAYGARPDDSRVEYLEEQGLARLERLWEGIEPDSRPLVLVGRLPDVRDTPVLSGRQKPSDASLAALNEALDAWIARHANVHLVPFSKGLADLREGSELAVGATTYTERDITTLFLSDRLHPSTRGAALVAAMVLEVLREQGVQLTTDVGTLEVRELAEALIRAAKGASARPQEAGSGG